MEGSYARKGEKHSEKRSADPDECLKGKLACDQKSIAPATGVCLCVLLQSK